MYKYEIKVEWKEGDSVSLVSSYPLESDMDHDKVSRIVYESLNAVGKIMRIQDE